MFSGKLPFDAETLKATFSPDTFSAAEIDRALAIISANKPPLYEELKAHLNQLLGRSTTDAIRIALETALLREAFYRFESASNADKHPNAREPDTVLRAKADITAWRFASFDLPNKEYLIHEYGESDFSASRRENSTQGLRQSFRGYLYQMLNSGLPHDPHGTAFTWLHQLHRMIRLSSDSASWAEIRGDQREWFKRYWTDLSYCMDKLAPFAPELEERIPLALEQVCVDRPYSPEAFRSQNALHDLQQSLQGFWKKEAEKGIRQPDGTIVRTTPLRTQEGFPIYRRGDHPNPHYIYPGDYLAVLDETPQRSVLLNYAASIAWNTMKACQARHQPLPSAITIPCILLSQAHWTGANLTLTMPPQNWQKLTAFIGNEQDFQDKLRALPDKQFDVVHMESLYTPTEPDKETYAECLICRDLETLGTPRDSQASMSTNLRLLRTPFTQLENTCLENAFWNSQRLAMEGSIVHYPDEETWKQDQSEQRRITDTRHPVHRSEKVEKHAVRLRQYARAYEPTLYRPHSFGTLAVPTPPVASADAGTNSKDKSPVSAQPRTSPATKKPTGGASKPTVPAAPKPKPPTSQPKTVGATDSKDQSPGSVKPRTPPATKNPQTPGGSKPTVPTKAKPKPPASQRKKDETPPPTTKPPAAPKPTRPTANDPIPQLCLDAYNNSQTQRRAKQKFLGFSVGDTFWRRWTWLKSLFGFGKDYREFKAHRRFEQSIALYRHNYLNATDTATAEGSILHDLEILTTGRVNQDPRSSRPSQTSAPMMFSKAGQSTASPLSDTSAQILSSQLLAGVKEKAVTHRDSKPSL